MARVLVQEGPFTGRPIQEPQTAFQTCSKFTLLELRQETPALKLDAGSWRSPLFFSLRDLFAKRLTFNLIADMSKPGHGPIIAWWIIKSVTSGEFARPPSHPCQRHPTVRSAVVHSESKHTLHES